MAARGAICKCCLPIKMYGIVYLASTPTEVLAQEFRNEIETKLVSLRRG